MAKKLTFCRIGIETPTVDRYKRLAGAATGIVHSPCDQLLAGAALSGDQHMFIGPPPPLHRIQHLLDYTALADDAVVFKALDLFFEVDVFEAEAIFFTRLIDQKLQFIEFYRLGQVVIGTEFYAFHGSFNGTVAGKHDYFRNR